MGPRIAPVEEPFEPEAGERLAAMMRGVDVPPLALFRTFVRHMPMAKAMAGWGGHTLGRTQTLDLRTREIVIWRVCARCGCEYEWGVHVAAFADAAGLTEHVAASVSPGVDPAWSEQDADVIRLVDELHDTAAVSDELWDRLRQRWSDEQLLDLLTLAGWYHAIAYVANGVRLPLEPWAARFPEPADATAR